MKRILVLLLVVLIAGCAPPKPDPLVIDNKVMATVVAWPTQSPFPTYTTYPTHTPLPTYTIAPTYTPFPTHTPLPTYTPIIKVVTATSTSTPLYTSTITSSPTITSTVTPTTDPLKTSRGNGIYLVGVEIAPGVWDSDGTNDDCYWETSTATGDIIDNHFGLAGGTAYISSTAFQVMFEDCGNWAWLQN